MTTLTFTPYSHVVQTGEIMGHRFCVHATRERFEKYTYATITWANGTVIPWAELMNYRTYPSSNCKGIAYPVPPDAPSGEALFRVAYSWQDRESGDYDDARESQLFWVGPDPEPKITVSHTVLCFGESVGVNIDYQTPGVQVDAFLYIGDRFVGYWHAEGDSLYHVALTVQLLNRWTNLVGYTGTGRLVVINHWDGVTREYPLNIRAPFYWATEQPYTGTTVTYRETYQGYTVWYLSGPNVYGAVDPYGNEMQSYNTTVTGMHTLIDNWLGAVYTLTVTSNLDTEVQVGEHTVPTNSSVTLLNGCYVITAPTLLMVGGAPHVIDYMQNMGTDTQFPGPSIVQCLEVGPVSTHIEYMGAEQDMLLETYRGVEIWYDHRPAQPPPYDKCLYASVERHGKWFPITDYTIEDVRGWIDVELDTPKNTSITITADRTVIDEGESVTFTGVLTRLDTGAPLTSMLATVYVNGEPSEAATTDSDGAYMCSIAFPYPGIYTVTAVFEGYESLTAATAETQVTTGVTMSPVPLLVAAAGAALLVTRK